MCGIAGIVWKEKEKNPSAEETVKKMMHSIRHRGPDGNGQTSGSGFSFGHQRLAIIDLQTGGQPMQSEDGRYLITFNGEIYNYIELRKYLESKGETFRTTSDTEVLLKLFMREELECLNKLNGMFAFAIIDQKRRIFWAARDHFGIKPFYYARTSDKEFCFSSEMKALFQHPKLKAQVDSEGLQQYLTFQFCMKSQTLFQGVESLEPATAIEWKMDSGDFRKITYWDLKYDSAKSDQTDEKLFEDLEELLADSIKIQLRSDVPLGSYLSGGLDSSLVSVMAAKHLPQALSTFTGRFREGVQYDESRYAKLVSDSIRAQYVDVVPTEAEFVESMQKLIYHMDTPAAGPGLFPQYIVSREAARSVKVILGGQGGDEIFGGYTRYSIAYLEHALKASIFGVDSSFSPQEQNIGIGQYLESLPSLKSYKPLIQSFWKEGVFDSPDLRYFRLVDRTHDLTEILNHDVLSETSRESNIESFRSIFNQSPQASYFEKMTYFDLKTLLPALLQVEDRVSMAVSLESRVPFLDRRVVEAVTKIPTRMKFKNGKAKHLLHEIAKKNHVPSDILNRQDKMGFPVPLKEWLRSGVVREFVTDVLMSKKCQQRGLFKKEALSQMIDREGRFGRQIWGMLCLELWHQTFIDS